MDSLVRMIYLIDDGNGVSIFPCCMPINSHSCMQHGKCRSPGKLPLIAWGEFQNRIATVEEVKKWDKQFGEVNIALVTGKISDIVVLDIDSDYAKQYVNERGIPECPTVLTGRPGGYHLYFKYPGHEITNFVNKIDGLDFRGDGGYVLYPGSKYHNGIYYRWEYGTEDRPEPPLPIWMYEFFAPKKISDKEPGWIGKSLNSLKPGVRNDTLFKVAAWLRRFGATSEDIYILLRPHAERAKLSLDELEIICNSAGRYTPDYDNVTLDIDDDGNFHWVKG